MKHWKRALALLLLTAMLLGMVVLPAAATPNRAVVSYSRQTAAEGIVLLKNEKETLPLGSQVLSVFGRGQVDTFHCGTGSGGSVQRPYSISILQGLQNHPGIRLNETLAGIYTQWCSENPANIGAWDSRLHLDEMPMDEATVEAAAAVSDVAAVVIGRFAGEGHEARLSKGSYYLTDDETELLSMLNRHFKKIIVMMNVGNVMDMSWTANYENITSVLFVWQGGIEMGDAVADILSGDLSPSGKLTDTIAASYSDYPCQGDHIFGNGDYTNYVDDIYVGYRYFETFAPDKVLYPFGFGLSYTSFAIEPTVSVDGDTVTVKANVTNTGTTYTGKEVVQVYYGAPQGKLGKPVKQLVGYVKTNEIAPGETQTVSVSFDVSKMASYDDAGKTGNKSAWVLEAGDYTIYVGNSVRTAEKAGVWTLDALRVTEQLTEANAIESGKGFDRMIPQDDGNGSFTVGWEAAPEETEAADLADRVLQNLPKAVAMTGDQGYKLIDVYNGKCTMDQFIAQLTPAQLGDISRGIGPMEASPGTPGNASVFAGATEELRSYGIPYISTCDGPSGLRLATQASLVPIGTLQACTWNNELIERLYQQIGQEMQLNRVECLLGPGLNIHRNPLCGRNFEYFSEDPVISGLMAGSVVRGLQSQGVAATPKHYALNNQEDSRNVVDARASERAQREIYLRAFEICVKTSKPYNLMTSYNKINGEWGHYNYDTVTTILREQWGYTGMVETDWWMQSDTSAELGNVSDSAYRIRAQVDVLMPGNGVGGNNDSILSAYQAWVAAGEPTDKLVGLTLGELQRGARNVLNFAMEARNFRELYSLENTYVPGADWFTTTGSSWAEKPVLTSLTIVGMDRFNAFDPAVNNYQIFRRDLTGTFLEVRAEAEDGASVTVTQATEAQPVATITVTKDGGKNVYRVSFTNKAGLTPTVSDPKYARVTAIRVDGRYIDVFYPTTYAYSMAYGTAESSQVELEAADGVDTEIIRDAASNRILVRAVTDDQAAEYVLSFPVKQAEASSDDFSDAEATAARWKVLQASPSKVTQEDGKLTIHTQDGEWYGGSGNIRNVYYQDGSGDYTASIKMTIPKPAELSGKGYYQFGITVFGDPDNYVDFNYCSTPNEKQMLQVRRELNGSNEDRLFDSDDNFAAKKRTPETEGWTSKDSVDIWMRVTKTGSHYAFSFKTEQTGDYVSFGELDAVLTSPKIGFYASNGLNNLPSVDVSFDDFVIEMAHLRGDDFEDGQIASYWTVDNRVDEKITEADGKVTIQTGGGEWYGTGSDKNNIENVFYQSAEGDWTTTTEMVIENPGALVGKQYYQFGVAAFDDYDNYVDLIFLTGSSWYSDPLIQVRRELNGECDDKISRQDYDAIVRLPVTENWAAKDNVHVWLRMQKKGDQIICSVQTEDRKAAGLDFATLGITTISLKDPKFGFYASHGNNGLDSVKVSFADVTLDAYSSEVEEPLPDPAVPITISAMQQTKLMGSDAVYTHGRITTEDCSDPEAPGKNLKYTEAGLYYLNLIDVEQDGWYLLESRYACGNTDPLLQLNHTVSVDGDQIASFTPGITTGWQDWEYTAPARVYLTAGRHTLRVDFNATLNVNFLRFTPVQSYAITVADTENGTVTAPEQAEAGTTVTITAAPAEGYVLKALTVSRTDDAATTVEVTAEGTFVMPNYPVTITAEFAAKEQPGEPTLEELVARAEAAQKAAEQAAADAKAAQEAAEAAKAAAEAAAGQAGADRTAAEAAQRAAEEAQKKAEAAQAAAETAQAAAEAAAEAAKQSNLAAAEEAKKAAEEAASSAASAAAAAASAAEAAESMKQAQTAQAAAEAAQKAAEEAQKKAEEAERKAEEAASSAAEDKEAAERAKKEAEAARDAAEAAKSAAQDAQKAAELARDAAEASNREAAASAAMAAEYAQKVAETYQQVVQIKLEMVEMLAQAQQAVADAEAERKAAEAAALASAKYYALFDLATYAGSIDTDSYNEHQRAALEAAIADGKAAIDAAGTIEAVEAAAKAAKEAIANAKNACPAAAFTDVDLGAWYHESLDRILTLGYMNGVSATEFDVNGSVTRAQLVTVLYRVAGEPETSAAIPFTDVEDGQWYTRAIVWAAEQGVVNGVGSDLFAPNDPLTREQIATILYRWAKAQPAGNDALDSFPDAADVSDYAAPAMNWAVENGLINGSDGKLLPKDSATRAQIAAILVRYLERNA